MSRIMSVQELLVQTGNNNPAAPKNRMHTMVWDFDSIPAGGSKEVPKKGDSTYHFIADFLMGGAWLAGAGSGPPYAIAGTPLILDADPSPPQTTGNQMPSLWHLRVEIATNDGAWQSDPVRWPLLFGDARRPMIPLFVPHIAAGITTKIKVYNDGPAAVSAQIAWVGHFIG